MSEEDFKDQLMRELCQSEIPAGFHVDDSVFNSQLTTKSHNGLSIDCMEYLKDL